MRQYCKLNYIITFNKIKAALQAFIPDLVNHTDTRCDNNTILKIIYCFFIFIKFVIKKLIWYGIIIPIITCIILKLIGLHNTENIFRNYFYFSILFFQMASKISKSKIISAGKIDYYYLKIFRYSKRKFICLKKKIAIIEMLSELPIIAIVMYGFQYNIRIIICNVFLIALIDCSLSCIFMEIIFKIRSKYLKLKYILTILSNILIPPVGIFFVYTQNIKPSTLSFYQIAIGSFFIIAEFVILFKSRNEYMLCRLILQQYYYDNSLLESLDRDKLAIGSKRKQVKKTGYRYFNYIFFLRHKQIIVKNCIIRCLIVLGISLIYGLFFSQFMIIKWKWIIPLFPFLLYQLSVSSKICEMFWRNCDINMSNHSFYTRNEFKKQLEKQRLKWLLTINMGLAVLCFAIFIIIINICNHYFPLNHLIFLSILIFAIMLLHALFDFGIYCYVKPYVCKKSGKLFSYLYKTLYFIILGGILPVIESIVFQ